MPVKNNIFIRYAVILGILTVFVKVATAQEYIDTLRFTPKDSSLKMPPLRMDKELLSAPDQIGFGKLKIDTIEQPKAIYGIKERILDSAYRSVSLYMALHRKEYIAWEKENYPKPLDMNINFNLGAPPISPSTGISILSIMRLFMGKDFMRDKWVMDPKERLKFEQEWRRMERAERDRKLLGKYDEEEQQVKKDIPLPGIMDYIFGKDYVGF